MSAAICVRYPTTKKIPTSISITPNIHTTKMDKITICCFRNNKLAGFSCNATIIFVRFLNSLLYPNNKNTKPTDTRSIKGAKNPSINKSGNVLSITYSIHAKKSKTNRSR